MRRLSAFTLVELLVVITIIVVLLALLAPAMDKAIYQAELAVCAARLDAIAVGVSAYSLENRRAYPYRPTLAEGTRWLRPDVIFTEQAKDDRPYLRQALGVSANKGLLDPFAGKIDLDHNHPPTDTWCDYALWFGMKYAARFGGGRGLLRMGDRLEWTDTSRGGSAMESFSVLASDHDAIYNESGSGIKVLARHPDATGLLHLETFVNPWPVDASNANQPPVNDPTAQFRIWEYWTSRLTYQRGPLDTNYAFTDGAVVRYNQVEWNDEEMARVPLDTAAASFTINNGNSIYHHMPRQ